MHKERVEERKMNPDLKNITKTVDSKPFCVKLRKLIKDLMRNRSRCSISPPARPPLPSTVPLALSTDDGDECESDDRSTANSSPSTGFSSSPSLAAEPIEPIDESPHSNGLNPLASINTPCPLPIHHAGIQHP